MTTAEITINGHTMHHVYNDAMPYNYAADCTDLDLEHLNITAPIRENLLSEFYAPHPFRPEVDTVYPLTTGTHDTDVEIFTQRARVHEQQWKRDAQERAKRENLPITTTMEPATNFGPENKWEEGAQRVTISLDGIEIERLLMFPAKGETLTGLITVNGYTN